MEKSNQNKRKITKKWEKSEIRKLIEAVEARPDIWDSSRANYSNRNIKQKLLGEIASELKVSIQEADSKFHALRTQFNRECNKEKQQKSGSASSDAYTSKWEYMASLRFLKSNNAPGITYSNLDVLDDLSNASSASSSSTSTLLSVNTDVVSIGSDSSEESASGSTQQARAESSNQSKAKKRKAASVSESDENDLFEKAMAVMTQKSDEFDILGQYVASEVRQMSDPSIRQIVKKEILKVLVNYVNVDVNVQPVASVSSARRMQRSNIPQNSQTFVNEQRSNQTVAFSRYEIDENIEYDDETHVNDLNYAEFIIEEEYE